MSKSKDLPALGHPNSIWRTIPVSEGDITGIRIGPAQIGLKRTHNEFWTAVVRSLDDPTPNFDAEWSRWALRKAGVSLRLTPMMPDRQIVVRPEYPFRLASGAEVRIFTRIPVWVGIFTDEAKPSKLVEYPTVLLSKTWFGDFLDGILCYDVSTTARRDITPEHFQPHTVICTINIRNQSDEDLQIDKLSLLVERLSMYELDGQLWSDEMDVEYRGGDKHSDIAVKGKAPSEASTARLLSPPRSAQRKSIAERTFRMIKDFHVF
jgi:hypothetical protein